jgi:hypothetical protein
MMRNKSGHGRSIFLAGAIVLAAAGSQSANAANIDWERRGAFEACLDDRRNDWVNAKAALIVNEDPAAGDIDDMDVAIWAVDALQGCERKTGQTNLMSEGKFSLHMAHWRDHIHNVAQVVRQRVRAD